MWAGMPLLPKEAVDEYDIDECFTSDELKSGKSLEEVLSKKQQTVFVIKDRANLDVFKKSSVAKLEPVIDLEWARKAVEACRVTKVCALNDRSQSK